MLLQAVFIKKISETLALNSLRGRNSKLLSMMFRNSPKTIRLKCNNSLATRELARSEQLLSDAKIDNRQITGCRTQQRTRINALSSVCFVPQIRSV